MNRFPQLFTTANLARLAIALVFLFSWHQLREMKPPREMMWTKRQAQGKEPSFKEHVQLGLWYGAAARTGLCAILLGISIAWPLGAKKAAASHAGNFIAFRKPELPLSGTSFFRPRLWWACLVSIVLIAFFMRLPRMDHSFWGDEADAIDCYVHGTWRPVEPENPQGGLRFEDASWQHTLFSAKHGPNNHTLFSISSRLCLDAWRSVTGKARGQFTEWPCRVPPLLAGLLSLVTLALLARHWGMPWLGMMAVLFMAMHPWHIKYSTEARGYALMLALLPAMLQALTMALERNRWSLWLAFAVIEFLLMWSWGGIVYALAAINLVALVFLLRDARRWNLLTRFTTAHLLAATAFISLYAPQLPQIASARERLLWLKGLPMDAAWLHNLLAESLTGIPWHGRESGNPVMVTWETLLDQWSVFSCLCLALLAIAPVCGMIWMGKRNNRMALILGSIILAGVIAALHFKYFLGDELRTWYLIFLLPALSLLEVCGFYAMATTLARLIGKREPMGLPRAFSFLLLISIATLPFWPMNISQVRVPFEDFKAAMAITREKHEPFNPETNSRVYTCWLWRYAELYDPRGDHRTRDATALRLKMEEVKAAHGELYVVVGFQDLAQISNPDMLAVLQDPAFFENGPVYWSRESIHTLRVYHMKL